MSGRIHAAYVADPFPQILSRNPHRNSGNGERGEDLARIQVQTAFGSTCFESSGKTHRSAPLPYRKSGDGRSLGQTLQQRRSSSLPFLPFRW